jgi:hypothetical protein
MTVTNPLVRPRFAKASAVMFLLLVPLVAHAIWDYVEARRLRTRLDAIVARGEPLTATRLRIAELTGGAAESDRTYRAAAALVSDIYGGASPTMGYRVGKAEREAVWPADVLTFIRTAVERNGQALALVDRAAALPFEGFRPDSSYTYQMSELITLARLCDWRAVLRATAGDGEGAADSLYSEARLGRALGQWLPQFRALAFVLQHGRPSDAARARLDTALAALDRDDSLKQDFLHNRTILIDRYLADERRAVRSAWPSPARTWRNHTLVPLFDEYEAAVRAAERPWPEPLQAVPVSAVVPANPAKPSPRLSFEASVEWRARTTKVIRCARLRASDGSLKLVDPDSGRFLELVNCKL